ncbi:ComEC/Rec2 family competence protein [Chromobacterium piscinae]|uniref:ComEC/Rec2 family competence protein n=1 Tax=Chromobacterium piscinae TaxID=686831 RepID=UPI001E57D4B9|nr:MBL fold metallo-hydrolase [Chromobacterium piscinae]MCD5327538.1 MBL fold metallo-hydrolase [Chromobacterium piscinae]
MGYEIDVLGVGEKSNSGDAITVRYGNLHGQRHEQTVIVIDGGYKENGQKLVDHLKTHYQTEKIDLIISTHPDQDHINGLSAVIEQMDVAELWIHQPWNHNKGLASKFNDGRITDSSIGERLKENLETAYQITEQAKKKGIKIKEPFTGISFGNVKVIGPTLDYYEELIPLFDGMPALKVAAEQRSWLDSVIDSTVKTIKKIFSAWGEDQLDDKDETSAKNNSSVITQIIIDGKRLIFTGDAGITALHKAADEIDACMSGAKLSFIQIPHHGSRRNVGPSVLNRILGEPVQENEQKGITAIASTAKEGEPKHPHKAVLNAFTHRGAKVLATRGDGIRHKNDAPNRSGWTSLNPEPYHYTYESEE